VAVVVEGDVGGVSTLARTHVERDVALVVGVILQL